MCNEQINLDVGGVRMSVGKNTLTSVPGSMLAEMFQDSESLTKDVDGNVFLDRDSEVFRHTLNYLRSNRENLPEDISNDLKTQIENEISYWNLYHDYGMKKYKYLTLPEEAIEINDILKSEPTIDRNLHKLQFDMWKKYGKMTLS